MNQLPNNQIDLWKIEVEKLSQDEALLYDLLSKEEQQRADRFVTPLLTSRYTISQGALRLILSRYLEVRPETIQYTFGPYKKPYLSENSEKLQFNLTHSNDYALVALSCQDEVGVDLEKIAPERVKNDLASSILTPNELAAFLKLPKELSLDAFFYAWTHKEAILKLIGTGLYKEMKELEVPLQELIKPHPAVVEGKELCLQSFKIFDEYIGAVASPKNGFQLEFFTFDHR